MIQLTEPVGESSGSLAIGTLGVLELRADVAALTFGCVVGQTAGDEPVLDRTTERGERVAGDGITLDAAYVDPTLLLAASLDRLLPKLEKRRGQ